jgi:hypothetical protein
MNRGRVGEERGGKEMDGCPLTSTTTADVSLLRSSHQGTESGWMEAISPLTDCRLNCLTDV